jgi:hypothetical protein
MDWTVTLAATAALLAVTVACGWAGSRPPDPQRGPRLLPYRFLMALGAVGLLLMVVHMLNLLGVATGR